MQTQMQVEAGVVQTEPRETGDSRGWNPATRAAFRFAFTYFILYSFPFPLSLIPYVGPFIEKQYGALWDQIVPWVGRHILSIDYEFTNAVTGSGDKTFDWVQGLCFVVLAATATLAWSVLDRKRTDYKKLYKWFYLYMRFTLASWMIIYGAIKAIPVQMPTPSLWRLLEPYGESSPMGILWTFIGASPAYTSVTGCVELLGGILLIIPRTVALGSLVSFFAMTHVFILNMCYDVPVKLFSFNLMLMAVFLMAPYLRGMADFFIFNRRVEPAESTPLFKRKWLNRAALAFQIAFGLYLLGSNLYDSYNAYTTRGGGAPRPPLYGIWSVEEFTLDGELKPPLTTDEARWRHVIFERAGFISVLRMTGPRQVYSLELDQENNTLSLGKMNDPDWKAGFSLEKQEPELMTLSGQMEDRQVRARLRRADESKFLLRNRGFHWIQESPFNR